MFSSFGSESEDISDEEYFNIIVGVRRERRIRLRTNHFDVWGYEDFFRRFRMSKQSARTILDQIRPEITNATSW